MLNNIKLMHFKCFEQLDLNCKQFNLLCGLNGTGKSSVIQALLILRQSFETQELLKGRLALNGERVAVGTGVDVLFEDAERDVLGFALESHKIPRPWEMEFDCSEMSDLLYLSPSKAKALNLSPSKAKALNRNEEILDLVLDPVLKGRISKENLREQFLKVLDPALKGQISEENLREQFLKVLDPALDPVLKVLDPVLKSPISEENLREQLKKHYDWSDVPPFGGKLVYVNAERVGPRKLYPVSTDVLTRRGDFGESGEYAWDYLNRHQNDLIQADDPRCIGGRDRRLLATVDQWMQDVCPGAHLQLDKVEAADALIAGFTFDRAGDVASRRYRATNVGFGLSYALPVILALLAKPGTLCLIENPEAHLHPRGQTKLAELAARATEAGVQVIAETHSDHFMDGVRIAVRDGLIDPEDAAFHYFEHKGNQTVVTSPQIDSDGRLASWPVGFFDQHDENLARLLAPKE